MRPIFSLFSPGSFNDVQFMGTRPQTQTLDSPSIQNLHFSIGSAEREHLANRVRPPSWLMACLVGGLINLASAADSNTPPTGATSATNLLATFQVKPGFRIELVAAEPMVTAPVAMAFDENGRFFVVEMRDYPNQRSATPHLGRVRMLENMNEDGAF